MNVSDMPAAPEGQLHPAGSRPLLPPYPYERTKPPLPGAVRVAVALMCLGLVGSVTNVIISVVTSGALKEAAQAADPTVARGQVDGLVGMYVVAAVIAGLVSAGLWLWMALAAKYGRAWARIVATVLFGLYTLAALAGSLTVTVTAPNGHSFAVHAPAVGELTTWLTWLAGLGTIIALWQRQSTAYYDAVKQSWGTAVQHPPYAPPASYDPYAGQQYGGAVATPSDCGSAQAGPPWYGSAQACLPPHDSAQAGPLWYGSGQAGPPPEAPPPSYS